MDDTPKRLWLEGECSKAGRRLAAAELREFPFTLLMFDFGETGHVAFFSTLTIPAMAESFRLLIAGWKRGGPRAAFAEPGVRYQTREEVQAAADAVAPPPGCGFGLLVGKGEITHWIATGAREDIRRMVEVELLPRWGGGKP